MSKYPSIFTRIKTDPEKEGAAIKQCQTDFEIFWKKIQKHCPPNAERTIVMRKLQEACMFMSRAIALSGFKVEEDDSKPMKTHDYPARQPRIDKPKNPPVIVLKRKKIQSDT